ncbi:DUF4309 domain-containing protein [Shimazuella kribbensis]|uniref:DUF4309 domain-containing protein n=1 Tax=Shimazuella kribbensis TaxID=139808 RepID=UPI0003F8481C|nr:DUF4309 domain-containing protein [Shimazuella kribbensis]
MKTMTKTILATTLVVSAAFTGFAAVTHAAPKTEVVQIQKNHKLTLEQTMVKGKQGKAINSENFGLGSRGKDIKKKWGKPTSEDESYLEYTNKRILFILEKGKVNNVFTQDKRYDGITYAEVTKTLGKPAKTAEGEDGVYASYKAGKNTVTFAFYYDKTGTKADTIKDVAVYKN